MRGAIIPFARRTAWIIIDERCADLVLRVVGCMAPVVVVVLVELLSVVACDDDDSIPQQVFFLEFVECYADE